MSVTRQDVIDLRELSLEEAIAQGKLTAVALSAEHGSLQAMKAGDVQLAAQFERTAHEAWQAARVKADLAEHASATADAAEDVLDRTEGFGPEDPRWAGFWADADAQRARWDPEWAARRDDQEATDQVRRLLSGEEEPGV